MMDVSRPLFINTLRNSDVSINSLYLPKDMETCDLISFDNDLNLVRWGIGPAPKKQSSGSQGLVGKGRSDCSNLLFFNDRFYYWADGIIYDPQGEIFLDDCSPFIRPIVFNNDLYYPSKLDDSLLIIHFSNHDIAKNKLFRMVIDICHNGLDRVYVLDDSGTIYRINNKAKIIWKETINVAGVCSISSQEDDLVVGTASGHLFHYFKHILRGSEKFDFAIKKVFVHKEFVFVAYSDKVRLLDINDLNYLYKELTYTPATCFLGFPFIEKLRAVDPISNFSYYPLVAIGCETGIIRIVS